MGELAKVSNLKVAFWRGEGTVTAVDGVSFSVLEDETLCIVGESGSGKSVTAKSFLRLLPARTVLYEEGSILYDGKDLLTVPERALRRMAGREISMIFQDPLTSLNPVYRVGKQMVSLLALHDPGKGRRAYKERAAQLLRSVEIRDPERVLNHYPHELSGGMRQRIMIAMAISSNPRLLIADEPTTALDVSVQAQILKLLMRIRREQGMALIFITHDLSIVYEIADRILVMEKGRIVESGSRDEIFQRPRQNYTKRLLNSALLMRTEDTAL